MRVTITIPDDLITKVDAQAERLDRSRAWMVRDLIAHGLTKRDEFNHVMDSLPGHDYRAQPGNALRCSTCGRKRGEHR